MRTAGVDGVLHAADEQLFADLSHKPVAKLQGLGKVVSGVDMQERKGSRPGRNARKASATMHSESLPPEKSIAGRLNQAAVSRSTKMASASRTSRWVGAVMLVHCQHEWRVRRH